MKKTLNRIIIAVLAACSIDQVALAKDLSEQVVIRRDEFGVPHILAETEEAALYGYGYAQAEDHILTIARLMLQARSEEAAYFGQRYARSDFRIKQFRMYEGAKAGYAKTAPWFRRLLDGFASGYNRYIEKNRGELPEWVKPIDAVDVLAHGRRMYIMEFYMRDIGQVMGKVKDSRPEPGSNMWAIGKERSESGNALLLGNPHLPWTGGYTFHESHIRVPGKLNFHGAALVGFPTVAVGFNDTLGWSHTVNPNDPNDIYELTLDPKNPEAYLFDGNSRAMSKETVSVRIKTDDGMVTEEREHFMSHLGPVLAFGDGKAYAAKSASFDEYRFFEQWYLMTKAKTFDEFRNVLDMQALPMFNIGYADIEGNCFYLCNGRFPERPDGDYDWAGIVPGDTSAAIWNDILPVSELPSLLNPAGGYVQNSNSSPWYTNMGAVLDRNAYAAEVFPTMNSLRSQMGLEMLEGDDSLTLEEIKEYKYNEKLLLADRVKASLIDAVRGQRADGIKLDAAADVLESWDNTVSVESRGSTLFVEFWKRYFGKAKPAYATPWTEAKPISTPFGIGDPQAARDALAFAIKRVEKRYGAIDVAWGDVHRFQRGDVDVPIGGLTTEYGAFRVIQYRAGKDGKQIPAFGDSYVFAVEFTTPPTAYSVLSYSQSGNPKSKHFSDQTKLFASGEWKKVRFTEDDIAAHTEKSYRP
jgi:acyl-homoserine-lactone acylase